MCQKSDFYLFRNFYNHLFKLQGIYREKSKKGHNSVKNKKFKNLKKTFLPIPTTSINAKNQASRSKGKGASPWTDKQTNKQTNRQTDKHTQNGPKTEDL